MKYRKGYLYQLAEDETFQTDITPSTILRTRWIQLNPSGQLMIFSGFSWDGPSGPTLNSDNSMRASLAHDALYQLMRMGMLEQGWREEADLLLDRLLKEDGMWALRRWYWLKGVRWFAAGAADPMNKKPVFTAP